MARFVLLTIMLGLLAILVVLGSGLLVWTGHQGIRTHITIGVAALLVILFAETLTILFFMTHHAWVKETLSGQDGSAQLILQSSSFKAGVYPWIIAAASGFIATFLVGGAVDAGMLPAFIHAGSAVLTLAIHLVAVYRTIIFVGMALDLEQLISGEAAP